jgi:hypothetical protein
MTAWLASASGTGDRRFESRQGFFCVFQGFTDFYAFICNLISIVTYCVYVIDKTTVQNSKEEPWIKITDKTRFFLAFMENSSI